MGGGEGRLSQGVGWCVFGCWMGGRKRLSLQVGQCDADKGDPSRVGTIIPKRHFIHARTPARTTQTQWPPAQPRQMRHFRRPLHLHARLSPSELTRTLALLLLPLLLLLLLAPVLLLSSSGGGSCCLLAVPAAPPPPPLFRRCRPLDPPLALLPPLPLRPRPRGGCSTCHGCAAPSASPAPFASSLPSSCRWGCCWGGALGLATRGRRPCWPLAAFVAAAAKIGLVAGAFRFLPFLLPFSSSSSSSLLLLLLLLLSSSLLLLSLDDDEDDDEEQVEQDEPLLLPELLELELELLLLLLLLLSLEEAAAPAPAPSALADRSIAPATAAAPAAPCPGGCGTRAGDSGSSDDSSPAASAWLAVQSVPSSSAASSSSSLDPRRRRAVVAAAVAAVAGVGMLMSSRRRLLPRGPPPLLPLLPLLPLPPLVLVLVLPSVMGKAAEAAAAGGCGCCSSASITGRSPFSPLSDAWIMVMARGRAATVNGRGARALRRRGPEACRSVALTRTSGDVVDLDPSRRPPLPILSPSAQQPPRPRCCCGRDAGVCAWLPVAVVWWALVALV